MATVVPLSFCTRELDEVAASSFMEHCYACWQNATNDGGIFPSLNTIPKNGDNLSLLVKLGYFRTASSQDERLR